MRFAFIQSHARIFHITTMCRVLEVSKAGYYAWCARPLCDRVKDDRVLTAKIREIQRQVHQRYGSPRPGQELRALGFRTPRGDTVVAVVEIPSGRPVTSQTVRVVRPRAPLCHCFFDTESSRWC